MLTFRNHEKYGPLFQKTQNNDLVVSRVKFLHLVLLNICCFEVILCAEVYELRVYFDALSRDQIHLDKLCFASTMVEIRSIWASDII